MGTSRAVPEAAQRLIAAQDGVISRAQAVQLGVTDDIIKGLVRDERWTRTISGIYLHGVGQPSFQQKLWIGHLSAKEPSAIGGQAALHRFGIGVEPNEVVVFVPPRPWRRLEWPYLAQRDGRQRLAHARGLVPIIRVEDAILDQAGHQDLEGFVANVTEAARLGRTTPKQVQRVLLARERQRNKAELVEVLSDLQGLESNLEYLFFRDVLRAHGLPQGRRQVRRGRPRFDVAYEEFRMVIEIDGQQGHVPGRFRDFRRDNDHAVDLISTFRYGSHDIRGTPCLLAQQLGRAFTVRGWGGTPRACLSCVAHFGR